MASGRISHPARTKETDTPTTLEQFAEEVFAPLYEAS
jgi:hypothetical protein